MSTPGQQQRPAGASAASFDPASFDPVTPAYTATPQAWFPLIHAQSPMGSARDGM